MRAKRFRWERSKPHDARLGHAGKIVHAARHVRDPVYIYDHHTGQLVAEVDPHFADQITRALNSGAGLVSDKPPF